VELDPAVLTALCDPEPAALTPDAGETTLFCLDGLSLGLRAFRVVSPGNITRAYLSRPACTAYPCSVDELSSATVFGWTAEAALHVEIDSRFDSVSTPVAAVNAPWPVTDHPEEPPVQRIELAGAPQLIADREPFPYCGRSQDDDPADVLTCFRASVLDGRRAEMIRESVGVEGGVVELFRFNGDGAILRYLSADGVWRDQAGTMVLGVGPAAWSFDPWTGGIPLP
jgi:hypothetical protein